jgi:DNA-binding FadR family transcriptional regulator
MDGTRVTKTDKPPQDERAAALFAVMQFVDARAGSMGDRLPAEREMAELLNLSRAQLRRCLKLLEKRGKIWRHVGMGTFLGTRPPSFGGPFSSLAERTNPREILEARLVLEPEFARMAALRSGQRDMDAMEQCLMEMGATEDSAQWLELDRRLHQILVATCGNSLMIAMYDLSEKHRDPELWARLRDRILTPDRLRVLDAQHAAILMAIRNRDPDCAAECMRRHIRSVRDRALGDT